MSRFLFVLVMIFTGNAAAQSNSETQSDTVYSAAQRKVFAILQKVEDENRLTDEFNPESLASLPVGIIKEIGTTRYIIAIDSAVFKPNGAYFNAYMAIQFPNSDKKIAFAARNIKFNPSGVVGGEQSKLVLVSRHSFNINPEIKLNLNPDGRNYIEWNCEGFQSINLIGEFEFSGNRMIPVIDDIPNPSQTVKATFEIHTNDIHNFITSASITPFTLQGLDDWHFRVTSAVVDMSEISNHPSMTFPQGYELPAGSPLMWTGFFLKELEVKLPAELSKHSEPTKILAQNVLIDGTGFTGLIKAENVFSISEASMSGWGFSLDEIAVSFISNQLTSGGMKGVIQIPAMGNNGLEYAALITYRPETKNTNYSFTISPEENISFDAFSAKVDIYQNSQITVANQNGKFVPSATLHGKIALNHTNASTPKVTFQNMTFVTYAPYITNGTFGFVSETDENSKTAGYKVSINNFRILQSNTNPKIGFDALINFMDAGDHSFSAGTTVNFVSQVGESNQNQIWSFKNVSVSACSLEVNTQAFYLKGIVAFFEDDAIFGKGFNGTVKFQIPAVMSDVAEVNAQFGNTDFRYFYVDAFIPVKIPLTATVDISRLIGGMYYHMRTANTMPSQFYNNITQTPSSNAHRTKYIPDASVNMGFKAGVSFEHNLNERALNGDALFEITFSSAGGLDNMKFDGRVYMMSTEEERRSKPAPVNGLILIQYDHLNRVLDATASLMVFAPGMNGNAVSKVHIEPEIWFVSVGRPTAPAYLNLVGFGTASAYVMVGNQLEPMAPVPSQVASLVQSNGLNNLRNTNALSNASGFVCGIRFANAFSSEENTTQADAERFQIYAHFAYGVGFDMMLANYGTNAHCSGYSEVVGMNGWVASGQLYCYLNGGVGIRGKAFGTEFDVEIISGTVAAILAGKVPKPSYLYGALACQYNILGGLIKGSFTFDFELGDNCTIVAG